MAAVPRILAAGLLAALAGAATADDSPFTLGTFAGADADASLLFEHSRTVDPADGAPEVVFAEALRVELDGGDGDDGPGTVTVRPDRDGAPSPLPPYPAGAGHPVILLFLESTVRTMAAATGGNPDYIRNALRERLWLPVAPEPVALSRDGAPLDASRLTYRPFAEDPNRGEMGPFAALELRFTFSEAVPGRLVAAEYATEAAGDLPALTESIRLTGAEGP
jgi:hypothetical protein